MVSLLRRCSIEQLRLAVKTFTKNLVHAASLDAEMQLNIAVSFRLKVIQVPSACRQNNKTNSVLMEMVPMLMTRVMNGTGSARLRHQERSSEVMTLTLLNPYPQTIIQQILLTEELTMGRMMEPTTKPLMKTTIVRMS